MVIRSLLCSLTMFSTISFGNPAIKMVAIGDSITAGFNSYDMGINPQMSWATGDDKNVKSHFQRLSEMFTVTAINKSVTGSDVTNTLDQIKEVISEINESDENEPIDYLTFLVGGNDLCRWPLDDDGTYLSNYTKNFQSVIEEAVQHNPTIKILISSLPDVKRLYEVGRQRRMCRFIWGTGRVCPQILSPRAKDRELYFKRWEDMNEEITKIAREYDTNVMFTKEISTYEFTKEDISKWDCFHPSVSGQQKISEKLWMLGWFN